MKKSRIITAIICAGLVLLTSLINSGFSVSGTKSDTNAKYKKFVPAKWVLEREIKHDINKDGVADALLILIQDGPAEVEGRPNTLNRQLLVLLGQKNNAFKQIALAKDLLLCSTCAGMMSGFGEAKPFVEFDQDKLYVNWLTGSRITYDITLIFAFDAKAKNLVLIADEVEWRDRGKGESIYTRRDYKAGTKTVGDRSEKIKKQSIAIDSVRYQDYES